MTMRTMFFGAIAAVTFAAGTITADTTDAQEQPAELITVTTLLRNDLNGLPGQETMVQLVEVAPGAPVPWHVHPDGHEIAYVIEGAAVLEVEGQPAQTIKAGGAFHVQPNLPHGGRNASKTEPAKLVVVRIKPKDRPTAVPAIS